MSRDGKRPADFPDQLVTRREVLALPEGDVVIEFPGNLSVESVDELEARLTLFMRVRRRIADAALRRAEPDGGER